MVEGMLEMEKLMDNKHMTDTQAYLEGALNVLGILADHFYLRATIDKDNSIVLINRDTTKTFKKDTCKDTIEEASYYLLSRFEDEQWDIKHVAAMEAMRKEE